MEKIQSLWPELAKYLDEKFDRLYSGFATKDDLKNFATKDDLKSFATKDDLKKFATKDDLKSFATKDDLKNFTTKDDLKKFATKKDINRLEKRFDVLERRFDNFEKKFDRLLIMTVNIREDLKTNYVTKEDLAKTEDNLLSHIDGLAHKLEAVETEQVMNLARWHRAERV